MTGAATRPMFIVVVRCSRREQPQRKGTTMPQGPDAFAGLNKNGLILFIILLLVCLPLCWLPWVIDSTKAEKGA